MRQWRKHQRGKRIMSNTIELGIPSVAPCTVNLDGAVGDTGFEAPENRTKGAGLSGVAEADVTHAERIEQMREGTLGSVHSWELVTAVDGPGTRMTVFLAGCPLRCLYCHNPDTMKMKDGEPVTSDEILKKIRRYRTVFKASGGGLTLSGGEVLMQPKFAARILHGAKEMGIHTCIDTSGFLGASCTDEMLDDIDMVLLDVKSGDEDTYKKVTGRALQPTIDFGDRLAAKGKEIWIRFVVVPGLTDSVENVANVANIVARWKGAVARVEVLPFHQMGRDKWANLGMKYELDDVQPPSKEVVERVRDQFRDKGLDVY